MEDRSKLLFGLLIIPAFIVALSVLALYFIVLPLWPGVQEYYFHQSEGPYSTYQLAIKAHIMFGGIALMLGSYQLFNALRGKHFKSHPYVGKTYVVAVSLSAAFAIFMAFHAYPGTIPGGRFIVTSGFIALALSWIVTLGLALYNIAKKGDIRRHMYWMIINVSLLFAAVTLRIQIAPIIALGDDVFEVAYPFLSWTSFLPNLIVGILLARMFYKRYPQLSLDRTKGTLHRK